MYIDLFKMIKNLLKKAIKKSHGLVRIIQAYNLGDDETKRIRLFCSFFDIGYISYDVVRSRIVYRNSDGKKVLHITNDNKDNGDTDEHSYRMTDTEFDDLISCDLKRFVAIPQIMNIFENIYKMLILVGDNGYTDRLQEYFSANKSIIVRRTGINSLEKVKADAYTLNNSSVNAASDCILIVGEPIQYKPTYDLSGRQYITFFISRWFKEDSKRTEYDLDLRTNVVPQLHAGGVEVVPIYAPDYKEMVHRVSVVSRMRYMRLIKKFFPSYFIRIRLRHDGNADLEMEHRALIQTSIKGYSELFGNGEHINFDNGFRRTVGNRYTENRKPHVYIFGPCFMRGCFLETRILFHQ